MHNKKINERTKSKNNKDKLSFTNAGKRGATIHNFKIAGKDEIHSENPGKAI